MADSGLYSCSCSFNAKICRNALVISSLGELIWIYLINSMQQTCLMIYFLIAGVWTQLVRQNTGCEETQRLSCAMTDVSCKCSYVGETCESTHTHSRFHGYGWTQQPFTPLTVRRWSFRARIFFSSHSHIFFIGPTTSYYFCVIWQSLCSDVMKLRGSQMPRNTRENLQWLQQEMLASINLM